MVAAVALKEDNDADDDADDGDHEDNDDSDDGNNDNGDYDDKFYDIAVFVDVNQNDALMSKIANMMSMGQKDQFGANIDSSKICQVAQYNIDG